MHTLAGQSGIYIDPVPRPCAAEYETTRGVALFRIHMCAIWYLLPYFAAFRERCMLFFGTQCSIVTDAGCLLPDDAHGRDRSDDHHSHGASR